jgi:hypothetical protein
LRTQRDKDIVAAFDQTPGKIRQVALAATESLS